MGAHEQNLSRYISFVLRHKPDSAGIELDEHGWANVDELIAGVSRTHPLDRSLLERIVAEDEKQRYSFNEDKTKIRANQGHSIPVDVELKEQQPPAVLWHGTGMKYADSIEQEGLTPKSRLYVHLSSDRDTAYKVGQRHGTSVIYQVDAATMFEKGFQFFLSANGIWLTKRVPVRYLMREISTGCIERIHRIINERIAAEGAFYYPGLRWGKELDTICEDMQVTRAFIENDCSDEELFWLSEAFGDIIGRTGDVAFLGCLKKRAECMTDEARKKEVLDEIRDAESRFIKQAE